VLSGIRPQYCGQGANLIVRAIRRRGGITQYACTYTSVYQSVPAGTLFPQICRPKLRQHCNDWGYVGLLLAKRSQKGLHRTCRRNLDVTGRTATLPACTHITRCATCGWNVALQRVIHHHAIGVEPPAQRTDGTLHPLDPPSWQSIAVAQIV
jgi:hypothetical protein